MCFVNGKGTILLHTVRQKPHQQRIAAKTSNSDVVVPVVVVAAVVGLVVDSVVVIHGVVVGSEKETSGHSNLTKPHHRRTCTVRSYSLGCASMTTI